MKLFEDLLDDIEAKHQDASRQVVDEVEDKCVSPDEMNRLTNGNPMVFTISIQTVHATDRINAKRLLDCLNETFINTDAILAYTFTNLHTTNVIKDQEFIEWELPYYLADSENVIENNRNYDWIHVFEVSIQTQWHFENATQREALRLLKRLCKFVINTGCDIAYTYIIVNDQAESTTIKLEKNSLLKAARDPKTIIKNQELSPKFLRTFRFLKKRFQPYQFTIKGLP